MPLCCKTAGRALIPSVGQSVGVIVARVISSGQWRHVRTALGSVSSRLTTAAGWLQARHSFAPQARALGKRLAARTLANDSGFNPGLPRIRRGGYFWSLRSTAARWCVPLDSAGVWYTAY